MGENCAEATEPCKWMLSSAGSQNEDLLQEHFIRAQPAQRGNVKRGRVCVRVIACFPPQPNRPNRISCICLYFFVCVYFSVHACI